MGGNMKEEPYSVPVILLILIFSGLPYDLRGIKVLDCRGNAKEEAYVGAHRFDCNLNPLQPFSSCVRFQFQKLIRTNMLVQLNASSGRPQLQMQIDVSRLRIAVSQEYRFILLEEWLRPNKWYLFCVMNDPGQDLGLVTYLNGKKLSADKLKLNIESVSNYLTIGYIDPNIYPGIKYVGNITQANVWTRVLSESELEDMAFCRKDLEGNLIKWSDGGWTYDQPIIEYDIELANFCEPEVELETHMFSLMNFYEAAYICEGIGGELITPTNLSYGQEIFIWARTNYAKHSCNIYWVGIWDDAKEDLWQFHRDGKLALGLSWAPDEPNGLHFENCGGLDFEGIIDDNCNTLRCPFCAVRPTTAWTLFGSCEDKIHNKLFSLVIVFDAWTFIGYGEYVIERVDGSWIWRDVETNKTLAKLHDDDKYYYPIGRKNWIVQSEICQQSTGVRPLLLSTCQNGQFTCNDGTCILHKFRCDLKYDCRDNSDEFNCQLIRFPSDYKEDIAPRGGQLLDNGSSSLQVSVEVGLETLRVDTNDMLLEVSFNLTLSWLDSRVMYTNLKEDSSLNIVPPSNNSLWSPSLAFTNTKDNAGTEVNEQTSFYVIKVKQSRDEDMDSPEEVTLFSGSANPIVCHRKYQASFTCDFDLVSYPFDSQKCFMDLRLRSGTSEVLRFDPERMISEYKGNSLLLEYEVGKVQILPYEHGGYSAIRVMIPLRRLHGYAYINIYLPTITMLIIGYLTLFFKIDIFEVRIMTALTTLLVMATLFTQVASSLPKTSYFKMVDVWFLFCIFSTFLVIVFHIVIDLMVPELQSGKGNYNESVLCEGFTKRGIVKVIPHGMNKPTKKTKPKWKKTLRLPQTPIEMEKLGRTFMALVFLVFNVPYWMMIYVGGH